MLKQMIPVKLLTFMAALDAMKSEFGAILGSLVILVVIFCIIFLAAGELDKFIMFMLIATGMIFFSNYFQR